MQTPPSAHVGRTRWALHQHDLAPGNASSRVASNRSRGAPGRRAVHGERAAAWTETPFSAPSSASVLCEHRQSAGYFAHSAEMSASETGPTLSSLLMSALASTHASPEEHAPLPSVSLMARTISCLPSSGTF